MKTQKQKLVGRQWAAIVILSYCGALALSMRFAKPNLPTEQQVNALAEIVWNLRNSLNGTSTNSTLLFGGFVGLGVLACRMNEQVRSPRVLLPVSFLISLVWLMGVSFGINNTLESIDSSPGQIVKSVCYVAGVTYLLYKLGQILFCFLEQKDTVGSEGHGKLARIYRGHPFGVSLFAILLFWLPHLIIAYPGYMCYDAWSQLTQFFGKRAFTTHHPPVHTIFMGLFVQLGLRLGNTNIGLYSSVIIQLMIAALVLAYTLFLMKKWHSPQWLRIISFGVIILVPYYTDYVVLEIKDIFYTIFLLLFVLELICILEKELEYFTSWKHILLLAISTMGTLLFRNNGKYVLYPTILALLMYFWANKRKKEKIFYVKPLIILLAPILVANLLSVAVIECYDIKKGSVAEALSLPFQQTARYVLECGDEVTAEEADAIRAILDYDHLVEKYNPRISDPVKSTYKGATKRELLRYFVVWIKMFFKHPEVYIKATMNQNYYLLYPFTENGVIYVNSITEGASVLIDMVNGELGISDVETLQGYKFFMSGLNQSFFSMPVIGVLSNQASYCILLVFLIVFAIHKNFWSLIVALFPLVLSAVVVVLSPAIQGNPRYAFPIIYAMPIIVAYYIRVRNSTSNR